MASSDHQNQNGHRSSPPPAASLDIENKGRCCKKSAKTGGGGINIDHAMTHAPRPKTLIVLASVALFVFFALYSLFFYVPESPVFRLASFTIDGLNSSSIDEEKSLVKSTMEVSFGIEKDETAEFYIYSAVVTVAYGKGIGLAKSFSPVTCVIGKWESAASMSMKLDMNAFHEASPAAKMVRDYSKNKRRRVAVELLLEMKSRFWSGAGRMAILYYDIYCANVQLVFSGSNGRLTNPDRICNVSETRLF